MPITLPAPLPYVLCRAAIAVADAIVLLARRLPQTQSHPHSSDILTAPACQAVAKDHAVASLHHTYVRYQMSSRDYWREPSHPGVVTVPATARSGSSLPGRCICPCATATRFSRAGHHTPPDDIRQQFLRARKANFAPR